MHKRIDWRLLRRLTNRLEDREPRRRRSKEQPSPTTHYDDDDDDYDDGDDDDGKEEEGEGVRGEEGEEFVQERDR